MKIDRLTAGLLMLVQLACLHRYGLPAPLSDVPTPVMLALSALAGALAIGILVKANLHSALGRAWIAVTSLSVVLSNVALFWIFTSTDDGSIGGGFVILAAGFLLALTAAALLASYLGSVLGFYLDRSADA